MRGGSLALVPTNTALQPSFIGVYVESGPQTKDYVAHLQGGQRDPDLLHQQFCRLREANTFIYRGDITAFHRLLACSERTQRGAKGLEDHAGRT